MDCTDLSADINTEGRLSIDGSNTSIWDSCDGDLDNDWHSVQLEYGKTYSFTLVPENPNTGNAPQRLEFFDRNGFDLNDRQFLDSDTFRVSDSSFRFTARASGTYFVDAFQGSLLSDEQYEIVATEINNDNNPNSIPIFLGTGFATYDDLETGGDIDTFSFNVRAGRSYYIRTYGTHENVGTLVDPSMQLRRGDQVLASSGDSVGLDPAFVYTATTRETLTVRVEGGGTGTYAVQASVVDTAEANPNTTSEMSFDDAGVATISGYINHYFDIDWHKVRLNFGDIIKVTMRGEGLDYLETPSLIFRDTDAGFVFGDGIGSPSDSNKVEYYYRANKSGLHYVVARTKRDLHNGAYQLEAEKVRFPAEPNFLFGHVSPPPRVTNSGETPTLFPNNSSRLLLTDETQVKLSDLLDLNGIEAHSYFVNSTIPIYRNGVEFQANQTVGILANELDLWTVQGDADQLPTDAEILIRANSGTSVSEWKKFVIASGEHPAALVAPRTWDKNQPVTYQFVTENPAYVPDGEYGDFRSGFSQTAAGQFITSVIQEFNSAFPSYQIAEAAAGELADINIFAGDNLGSPFIGFWPGAQLGGDLILDTATFLSSAELSDSQRHQILQGLGSALGLNYTSGVAFNDSVMGDIAAPNSLAPESFSRFDWVTLRNLYGAAKQESNPSFANTTITGSNRFQTISSNSKGISVGGGPTYDNSYNLDLRDRARSFAREGTVPSSEVYVAVGARVLNATGGNGDDLINGNGYDNELTGNGGNDIAIGGTGNDRFIGGLGDDTFIHYFGDGQDYYSDSSGVDTLCFFGRTGFNVSQLSEDYLFTRNGNILDVSLTLDGGEQEGLVQIDTGFGQNNLVEKLELWHNDQMQQRISLFNLWNQLAPGQSARFELTQNSDNFGSLVTQVT